MLPSVTESKNMPKDSSSPKNSLKVSFMVQCFFFFSLQTVGVDLKIFLIFKRIWAENSLENAKLIPETQPKNNAIWLNQRLYVP